MRNFKNEKGAITLVVLVTMLFLLSFLMSAYMIVSNKAQKQSEISKEIQQMYSNDQDLNVLYDNYINDEIIPIYTVEQLLNIGNTKEDGSFKILRINNKYCEMTLSATYALMNDLEFDASSEEVSAILGGNDWTPINSNENFEGYFEGNGHTITVTDKNGKVVIYSGVNNYSIQPEIILSSEVITKEIEAGTTATETLTAELKNIEGDLTWESSNPDVVEVIGTGNTATLTFKTAGTATITVSYEEYKEICRIEVTEI